MEFDVQTIFAWGLPLLAIVVIMLAVNWTVGRAFINQPRNKLYRQLSQVAVMVLAMIGLVLVLPFDTQTQGQLLSLFGLVLTAIIALSSTTLVSNAMAGVTLKVMGTFHTGDFIRVKEHFGRVRNKTLLHTEIQSEDRDTITLPNMFIITNPVQVVDQSGTLISADVSIGYDVHRQSIREQLLLAAEDAELTESFTQILELGNFAVAYRVSGLLQDVSKLVSKKTELRARVIDRLHAAHIEVMTPNVMEQRPLNKAQLPHTQTSNQSGDFVSGKAERIMFDKADLAARITKIRAQCEKLAAEIKEMEAADPEKHAVDLAWRKHQLKAQQAFIQQVDDDL